MISKQQKPIKSGFHAKTNADEIIKGVDLSNKVAIVTGCLLYTSDAADDP